MVATATSPITVVHPGDSLTTRQRLVYVVILGALTALGPFTIDLYLPAFPVLEVDFHVPAALIQLTLTGTTIGFALGQLLVGPWSDRVGRRLPIIIATGVHVVACVARRWRPTSGPSGPSGCCRGWARPPAAWWRWRWCATCSAGGRSW